jgi:hypothetical protein
MFGRVASALCFLLHISSMVAVALNRSNGVISTIAYSPLIFLNFVFAMLLLSAGKQLYQKNF